MLHVMSCFRVMAISRPLKHIILLLCFQCSVIHVVVLQDRRSPHPLVTAALQRFGLDHFGLMVFLHDLVKCILELLFIQKVDVSFISFQFLAASSENTLVWCLCHV
jgi:hypothetical protein